MSTQNNLQKVLTVADEERIKGIVFKKYFTKLGTEYKKKYPTMAREEIVKNVKDQIDEFQKGNPDYMTNTSSLRKETLLEVEKAVQSRVVTIDEIVINSHAEAEVVVKASCDKKEMSCDPNEVTTLVSDYAYKLDNLCKNALYHV